MKTFANKLKELGLNKELLLRQVAAAIEEDTSMGSKFESGERFPTREQIEKLATFFKVSEEDLLVDAFCDKLSDDLGEDPLATEILKQTIVKLKSINSKE